MRPAGACSSSINDWIHGASSLTKTSTTAVQTFMSPLSGLIGTVAYGEAEFYRGPDRQATPRNPSSRSTASRALPRVDIIMAYENMDGALIDAAVAAGAKGIVIAGVGNGNLTATAVNALAAQAKKGIVCVRVVARDHRTGRPERRARRRQAWIRGVAGQEPAEVQGPAPARVAEAAQHCGRAADLRRVLTRATRDAWLLPSLAAAARPGVNRPRFQGPAAGWNRQ